jgi:hypothetical protein
VLLVVAAFSRYPDALTWARNHLEDTFGPVALAATPFEFNQTRYYEATMGPGLQKQFLAFERLCRPEFLKDAKHLAGNIETRLAANGGYPQIRPVNLDPGVLSLGKFQLATTKDQAHRVYLGDGIYAETTLRYHDGTFEPWPWTYADYRQSCVIDFLNSTRDYYRGRLQSSKT